MPVKPVLILGGTAEARVMAGWLDDRGADAILSLAGDTPERSSGLSDGGRVFVRRGGFGGVNGLADYLRDQAISLIADMTHPFAAVISSHAVKAAALAGVPYRRFERPPWRPVSGDQWRMAPDMETAASWVRGNSCFLLAIGHKKLKLFADCRCQKIIVRMISRPDFSLPPHWKVIVARPPFSRKQERRLFGAHGVSVLVARNSGGTGAYGKLEVARDMGLPVIMIERPSKPSAAVTKDLGQMLAMILAR